MRLGINVLNLFFATEEETKEAGAFDPGKPYQPSQMFESKAGA
jgi:hypothetical protein